MRVTIIRDDNTVMVDGERHEVDCSKLPTDFHALQWDGDAGEVEHVTSRCEHCGARSKKGNEFIRDLTPYQPYVDAWRMAKLVADEATKAGANVAGPQG